jgi:hypothetical protein
MARGRPQCAAPRTEPRHGGTCTRCLGDARSGAGFQGGLVGVPVGGHPGADVQELADAFLARQEP